MLIIEYIILIFLRWNGEHTQSLFAAYYSIRFSRRKAHVRLELRALPAAFFINHHFYLKERLTDILWLFRLTCFPRVFLIMNETNLSLQGTQLTAFVADDKIWVLSKNQNFGIFASTTLTLTAFLYIKTFLISVVILTTTFFFN